MYQELMALLSVFDANPLDEVTQEAFKAIRERLEAQGEALLKQEYNDVFVSPESSFIPLVRRIMTRKGRWTKESRSFRDIASFTISQK